jgi:hypothetical protein
VGRKPNAPKAARRARVHHQFREAYLGLDEAAVFLRDQGDVEAIVRALDQLEAEAAPRPIEGMADQATRSDKAKYLADRYVAASHIVTRCRLLLDDLTASKEAFRDQLIATLAVPDDVREYQRTFLDHLSAAGIGQPDLHTGGRKMADEVAVFIRQYHAARRGGGTQGTPDNHADVLPLSSWSELPRQFAGVKVVDVEDPKLIGLCPLPPETDIAKYTEDGHRPALEATRRETVRAWSTIIGSWCERGGEDLLPIYRAVWALLLSHYMQPDTSNLANLEAIEVASPWVANGVVRLKDVAGTPRT